MVTGSLGARITELKQKVIAENPRSYGLAVPRKSLCFLHISLFAFFFSPHMYSVHVCIYTKDADFVSVVRILWFYLSTCL